MRFAHFFVDRPVFAAVLSIIITLVGAVSYFALPVTQYPEIAPPTVQVQAVYPGADAATVSETVAAPLEQEINGVDGMIYMTSQSTGDGVMSLSIVFETGTDVDTAQVLVQNRVAIAEPRLPEEVRRLGVNTEKRSPDLMMVAHVYSPDGSRSPIYVSNYVRTQVLDQLRRIDGVGAATAFAERAYAMRIWIDPLRAAARNMTADEIVAALRANNVQVASGVINREPGAGSAANEINLVTRGRLTEPEQFAETIIRRAEDGAVIRLRDVARVELGAQDYSLNGYLDGVAALPIGIFQEPGSNALATAAAVKASLAALSDEFPPGVTYAVVYDTTLFVEDSIAAVYQTIFEAAALVILVILAFLHSWRAAVVPIVAIPVSLIGTFALMGALGLSLNTLSLFGLILAIGIVVDDAIVIVENVERRLREGQTPKAAAHGTLDDVGGAVIATSLVLLAVFVPTAFISGISGQFFLQFAITIASATVISTIVSLTLSPAMCALLLRAPPSDPAALERGRPRLVRLATLPGRLFASGFNALFDRLAAGYGRLVARSLRVVTIFLALFGGLAALGYERFTSTPTGFIPEQDQGYLIAVVQLPPGAKLARTDAVIRRLSDRLMEVPGVAHAVGFAGLDGATFTVSSNAGAIFVVLDPFEKRLAEGRTAGSIQAAAFGAIAAEKEGLVFVIPPPPVAGVGTGGGWKLFVQDRQGRGFETLEAATGRLAGAAAQTGAVARPFSLFNTRFPALRADIDRTKAELLGIPADRVTAALEVYMGSAFVNEFNFLGRTYRVTAQADAEYRDEARDISAYRVRNDAGETAAIGSFVTFARETQPYRVPRHNGFPAAELQGETAPGFSTGQALLAVEAAAAQALPAGFSFEWVDLAYQERAASGGALIIFGLAIVFVYLALAALYESWLLPFAVILIVPLGLLSAVLGVNFVGSDVNVLVQIGLVVLVALAAKNAILIVEFARQAESDGSTRVEAAIAAAQTRLRPILMTAFSFILGVAPLVWATGPGAEMRQAMGVAVFSGMLGVTLLGLVFTPVFYVAVRWLAERLGDGPKPQPATTEHGVV